LFRALAGEAGWEATRIHRATESERLDFPAETTECPSCGASPGVLKTQEKWIVTLSHGLVRAREIIGECDSGDHARPIVFRSAELRRLVPRHQRYGWDVIVHVGLKRYLEYRQRAEIQRELEQNHGIKLSTGAISLLCDRFIQRLEALHRSRVPQLRTAIKDGYALHIDSTNETGKGGLFVCMEGSRGWYLNSGRIATERWDTIQPVVEETVDLFGLPIATVRDLSKACAKAVKPLRELGVPDLICHFHFVADIGGDLLAQPHHHLKSLLNSSGVTKTLRELLGFLQNGDVIPEDPSQADLAATVFWVLHGHGRTPRFPYGLAHLEYVERIQSAIEQARVWVAPPFSKTVRHGFEKLDLIARSLELVGDLTKTVDELRKRAKLFDELRRVLRMEDPSHLCREPQLPEVEVLSRTQIQTELDLFESDLRRQAPKRQLYDRSPTWVVLDHLSRYRDRLFGHPVIRDETGSPIFVVSRTNNILETGFAANKQHLRRRTGRRHLGHDIEAMPPQAVLVENLRDPTYVRIVCGSLENLPPAFADLDTIHTPVSKLRPRPFANLRARVKELRRNHAVSA